VGERHGNPIGGGARVGTGEKTKHSTETKKKEKVSWGERPQDGEGERHGQLVYNKTYLERINERTQNRVGRGGK